MNQTGNTTFITGRGSGIGRERQQGRHLGAAEKCGGRSDENEFASGAH